jgi:hypothetical protein
MCVMSSELDLLRAVLCDRAALAPEPADLLPAARRLIHRRQVRRRVGLVAGVVVVTALALVGTGLFGHLIPHDRSAHQPGGPLPPPVLPFTVGAVPSGYVMDSWYVSNGMNQQLFYNGHQRIYVQLTNSDPSRNTNHQKSLGVNGHPAVLGITTDTIFRQLSWQAAPGRWMYVYGLTGTISEGQLLTWAESVSLTPTTKAVALRIASLPAGLAVVSWSATIAATAMDVTVTLCPPNPPARGDHHCIWVHMGTGAAPKIDDSHPNAISVDSKPVVLTPRNTAPMITTSGRIVTRQVDSTHWVSVRTATADPAIVLRLAMSVTVG